jgi:hypothetical protein
MIVAIDPGKSGGIACFDSMEGLTTSPMPDDMAELLFDLKEICPTKVFLEKVTGYIGVSQPGSRMFEFGKNYGYLLGGLHALQIPVILVPPQKWQKPLGLGTSGGDKTAWKKKLKAEASRRFPQLKVTLKTADALLLLDYAMTAYNGRNQDER